MWPRVVELMLACWLAVSPYIFAHDPGETFLWWVDHLAALVVATAALLSFHRRLYRAHLATLAVAATLIVLAYLSPRSPPSPAYQNYMGVGVLLAMFAILPSRCDEPPRRWREFYERKSPSRNKLSGT